MYLSIFCILFQEIFTAIGLIIGVLRLPERFWPGGFDLMFNSHNLLHMLPVVGAYHMHKAYMLDYQWLLEAQTDFKTVCQ